MEHLSKFLFIFFITVLFSCGNNEEEIDLFESIPVNKYYAEDPFAIDLVRLNGVWQTDVLLQNGIVGEIMLTPDFDKLLVKPNGILNIC